MEEKKEIKIINDGKWIVEEGIEIDCYVTSDARRILSLRGTARAMGLKGGGSQALVRNLKSKWIEPYLTDKLKEWMVSVEKGTLEKVKVKGKPEFYPFDGELFVDVCKAYVIAQKDGIFDSSQTMDTQHEVADKLLSIMSAFAKVGIVALIDEITGYQYDREKDELQKLLATYVREEYLPWTRRFPEEFYKEMFRLKEWEYKGNAKSPLVGKYTNRFVYDVLPEAVLEELKKNNPKVENKKYRKYKHHQFLTEETGVPHLDKHLVSVITLMRACDTWEQFESMFAKVFQIEGKEGSEEA